MVTCDIAVSLQKKCCKPQYLHPAKRKCRWQPLLSLRRFAITHAGFVSVTLVTAVQLLRVKETSCGGRTVPGASLPVPGVWAQRWWSPHAGFDQLACGHAAHPCPSMVPFAPAMVTLVTSVAEMSGLTMSRPGCVPLLPRGGSMWDVP